jgi:hypothetical protein
MKPGIGKCSFCGEVRQLIRAHIIPQSFFEVYKGDGKRYAVLVDSKQPLKSAGKFHQAGIYDMELLCVECEPKFSEFDRYGWEVLGPITLNGPSAGIELYKFDCDTDKLRRFVLSILWRASASTHPLYKQVRLGPYQTPLKDRIFDQASLLPTEFPMFAQLLEPGALEPYKSPLFPPPYGKLPNGAITHSIYFGGGLKFMINTGKIRFPELMNKFLIRNPDHFILLPYPKKFMSEMNFVPHMLNNIRRAEPRKKAKIYASQ